MTDRPEQYVLRVPRNDSGRLELLASRPPLWEYLLFGNVLYASRDACEDGWRDFQLNYTLKVGQAIAPERIPQTFSERFSHAAAITGNLERVLAPSALERAFGRPGESGDSTLIQHMATRLIDIYASLLNWAEETRALRVPDWAERLKELSIDFVRQPIERTHDFVDEFTLKLEEALAKVAAGEDEQIVVTIELTFEVDDDVVRRFDRELRRVGRHIR